MSMVMPKELVAKQLPSSLFEMEGLSRRQIEEHYTLYEGYIKKVNEIHSKLPMADKAAANQTFSEFRELKVELSFALDGVKLHEAYFWNLGGKGSQPSAKTHELIEKSFGSIDAWKDDLKATGISGRGWAITAFDFDDNMLHNYIADSHNSYGIWNALPVIVLDTYEHAYVIDYGVKRPPYIDAFFNNLNWDEISKRIDGLVIGEPRQAM